MSQGKPPTALEAAEDAYRAKFGELAPVWGFMPTPGWRTNSCPR